MNFVLCADHLPQYTKKDIDNGETPLLIYEIVEACRCAFFLSHAIRKEVNFAVLSAGEDILVAFQGRRLRYLGPDERSQALLFGKALEIARALPRGASRESTPGLKAWKGHWAPVARSLLGGVALHIQPSGDLASPGDIARATSCILPIAGQTTVDLSQVAHDTMVLRCSLPPPLDTAGRGAQILHLHHVRDTT